MRKASLCVVALGWCSLAIAEDAPPPPDAVPAAAAPAVETPKDETPKVEAAASEQTAPEEATKKPEETEKEPAKPEEKPPEEQSAGDEIVKIFPLEGQEWLKDPFLVLNMEMEAVVSDFGDGKPKPPAETTQPRIVSRFDSLIEILEKSCNGSGSGNGGVKPAQASVIRKGPGGMGELRAPKKNGKGFEDLTPKEREKILQSKTEGFPPGFEDVLADYFRRLSNAEQSADVAAPANGDAGSE